MIEALALPLAAVFAVAAVAKLADLDGSRSAVAGFGVPDRLARPLGLALPVIELAIAVTLVPTLTSRYAAMAAAALLAVFSAAIGVSLARGRRPDCHCFGRLHSAPAGWGTLVRNLALAGLATAVALSPEIAPTWQQAGVAALVGAAVGQSLLSVVLLRRYGRALRRIDELEATDAATELEMGEVAPGFSVPDREGRLVSLRALLAPRRPVLLVFVDAGCGPCRALLTEVATWKQDVVPRLTVAVVARADAKANRALAQEYGIQVLLADGELFAIYGVTATPSAVLIDADGRVERTTVAGAEAIQQIVKSFLQPPWSRMRVGTAGRRTVGAGVAGAAAIVASTAHGSSSEHAGTEDPELQAIDAALIAAEPRLLAAAERSERAVRSQATLIGKGLSEKRAVARRALAAERQEVLKLRAAVAKLSVTGSDARAVKAVVEKSLALLARSLSMRVKAIGAPPKVAANAIAEGQKLFLRSVEVGIPAAKRLGRS